MRLSERVTNRGDFVRRARILHGNKYDYSKVKYVNSIIKVIIICLEHGEFKQSPNSHLSGRGCPEHGRLKTNQSKRLSVDDFLNRSREIHKGKYYYYLVDFKGMKIKVSILCSKHGEFKQTPSKHVSGQGCPGCAKELIASKQAMTTESFIFKAKKVHGDLYDYSLVDYKRSCIKVKIICKKHGLFEQTPNNHIMGMKCIKCANKENGLKHKLSTQEFINRAYKVHLNRYDYSETEYISSSIKVKIRCRIHGPFDQIPHAHWRGQGCPVCDESHGERIISQFLDFNNIIYEREKTFRQCRHKQKLPFDFYIPKLNMCIEYDGRQHYFPSKYFGGAPALELLRKTDAIKTVYCLKNGIKLVRITYNEKTAEAIGLILKEELSSIRI